MKRRILTSLLPGIALCALCGCALFFKGNAGSKHVQLTYLRTQNGKSGEIFATADRTMQETGKEQMVSAVLDALRTPPRSDCASPFKDGIVVLSESVDGSSVTVNLSGAFRSLSGVDQSVVTVSLVRSLCSVEGIDYVRITSENQSVDGRRDRYLSASDLVFSSDVFAHVRYDTMLYLPDKEKDSLVSKMGTITVMEDGTPERAVVDAVFSGAAEKGADLMIPKNVKLISAETRSNICYLNFSADFSALSKQYGKLVVYSLVDSLCRLEYIRGVQFLIEGKTVAALGGIDVSEPVEANYNIITY